MGRKDRPRLFSNLCAQELSRWGSRLASLRRAESRQLAILMLLLASAMDLLRSQSAGDLAAAESSVSPEDLERFTALYGLDKPLAAILHLDHGLWRGIWGGALQNTSVNSIVAPWVWPTVLLMGTSASSR